MISRAPFLKTRYGGYGGYYHREIPEENGELTHVGGGRHAASICVGIFS